MRKCALHQRHRRCRRQGLPPTGATATWQGRSPVSAADATPTVRVGHGTCGEARRFRLGDYEMPDGKVHKDPSLSGGTSHPGHSWDSVACGWQGAKDSGQEGSEPWFVSDTGACVRDRGEASPSEASDSQAVWPALPLKSTATTVEHRRKTNRSTFREHFCIDHRVDGAVSCGAGLSQAITWFPVCPSSSSRPPAR